MTRKPRHLSALQLRILKMSVCDCTQATAESLGCRQSSLYNSAQRLAERGLMDSRTVWARNQHRTTLRYAITAKGRKARWMAGRSAAGKLTLP